MSDQVDELDRIEALRAGVGSSGVPSVARHGVNEAMIAHWCDAVGDTNPCYVDSVFAAGSIHSGIVAPPMMLDVWDRPGLGPMSDTGSPRGRVLEALEAAGYSSIVAVNTELEIGRYLRLGERPSNVETLDDVSSRKQTALGSGYFVTTRHRYTVASGEQVGTLMFRVLKYRPGALGAAAGARGAGAPSTGSGAPSTSGPRGGHPPDPDPRLRPRPAVNRDNAFFWEGAPLHQLRLQRCNHCQHLIMPPGPQCPKCASSELSWIVSSGHGRLYSYAIPHFPQVPGFSYPLLVGLVELDEGVRIVSNLIGLDRSEVQIGMPLELSWLDPPPAAAGAAGAGGASSAPGGAGSRETDPGSPMVPLPRFHAASPARREDTVQVADIEPGHRFPVCGIPITTTLIVAGAVATRDYTGVHHDRDIAVTQGSKDVFLNINTSVGLLQRVVSDWVGPEAVFRSVRVRLGSPGYPGDVLTFSGAVREVDRATGAVTVDVRATGRLGDHLVGAVVLELETGGSS